MSIDHTRQDAFVLAARLTAIVESSEDAIVGKDLDGVVTSWNASAERIFGYTAAEMIGKPFARLIPPERMKEEEDILAKIGCGERVGHLHTVRVRKDGRRIHVSVTVSPIRDANGRVVGASKVARDITERRRVAVMLAGQRDLLRKIANGDPLSGTLEDMLRFAESLREGMLCSFLFFDEKTQVLRHGAAPSLPDAYNQIVDGIAIGPEAGSCGTAAYRREPVIVRDIAKDPLWAKYREIAAQFDLAACWSTPVFGTDGNLLGTFAMYFREPCGPDPDDLKLIEIITQTAAIAIDHARSEEKIRRLNASLERRVAHRTKELEEANRELESFSYSVSHDLRAPLRHVLGFVDLLKRATEGQLSEKAVRYMDTIAHAAERMSELIDDLLAFSRMGRTEMRAGTVVLDDLVQQVIKSLAMEIGGRRIEWKIEPLPEVTGDAAMLRIMLSNLIANAVKYTSTRDSARIEIGCSEKKDGRATIFIRDNGVGFDMKYAHKLFGVFQRLHGQEEFEGTGIGLATVRRVISRHGGTVSAESEVDHGATFSFAIGLASPMPGGGQAMNP